ncbi:hypothetical protein KSP35_00115 [Aquihabitans sp. G128]|uniref:type II toxin-antitoxin system Phd/YefM family antitoxin n=1 Tax=Aquihabitans sp. G128 TaxID=2849779 RepID=UPI001C24C5D4|nr:hypothetical protein [Aquihabitans sp. G128]QXC61297.1 hypothetical protein KSP35_00115 [Aquihabitans sp. G128]
MARSPRPDRPAVLDQALALQGRGRADGPSAPPPAASVPPAPSATSERLGIRELRGRLTSLVRRAGGGERIVITIGGRAVAQLGPVEPSSAQVSIDDLAARGLIEPARRGDRPADPEVLVDSWTGRRLDRALREVRGA